MDWQSSYLQYGYDIHCAKVLSYVSLLFIVSSMYYIVALIITNANTNTNIDTYTGEVQFQAQALCGILEL